MVLNEAPFLGYLDIGEGDPNSSTKLGGAIWLKQVSKFPDETNVRSRKVRAWRERASATKRCRERAAGSLAPARYRICANGGCRLVSWRLGRGLARPALLVG